MVCTIVAQFLSNSRQWAPFLFRAASQAVCMACVSSPSIATQRTGQRIRLYGYTSDACSPPQLRLSSAKWLAIPLLPPFDPLAGFQSILPPTQLTYHATL